MESVLEVQHAAAGRPATSEGVVEILADLDHPGGFVVLLDRIQQSFVAVDDPTYLEFPYVQALAGLIDGLQAGPLDAVHIGGGAATLPRWLAVVRPGSRQIVVEPHAELVDLVDRRLPIDPTAGIDMWVTDGRSGLTRLDDDTADVVVIDAFAAGRVPADLTTVEAFTEVFRVLRDTGLLVMNLTATIGSPYLRRLVAALVRAVGPEPIAVVLCGEPGDEVGNLVLAAARPHRLPASAHHPGPFGPPTGLSGQSLLDFIDGTAPLTDADPLRSPIPRDEIWRVGGAG